jgi:hypothetical protein
VSEQNKMIITMENINLILNMAPPFRLHRLWLVLRYEL